MFKVGDIVHTIDKPEEIYLVLATNMQREAEEDCLFMLELTHPTNDGRARDPNDVFIQKVKEQFNVEATEIGFNTASCRKNAESVIIVEDPKILFEMNRVVLQAKVNNPHFAEVFERLVC